MPRLFEELKRRNVFKVGTAYVVLAWLLAQITDVFLEPFGAPDWVIKTILLVLIAGFPLALFFAWAFEMTPEGIKKEKDVDRSQSITHETGQKLNLTIIFILVIAVGYFAYDKFALAPQRDAELVRATEIATTGTGDVKASEKSIAVLPFVNMSEDAGNEYFSDGISEEILNSLARVKELKVAGRTSSFSFKGKNQDLRQIGDALGVGHILEGSVRKAGTKVRITAQLIQVDDGFHVWSDTYDRELDDVFAIQDEIATAILEQLKAQLLDGEQIIITSEATNSEVYDLYLLARQRIYDRTRPALESAAELLDKAIATDPDYSPAYAQRGITALLLSEKNYGTLPEEQSQTQAKLYLDQALRLNPQQPEALAGTGLYFLNIPGKYAEAIEPLENALTINPNLINASNWLATAYGGSGRWHEQIAILEQTVERDPLYRPGIGNLHGIYVWRMELDKAEALLDQVRPFMPGDQLVYSLEANQSYARGNAAKGLILSEKALEMQPDNAEMIRFRGEGLLRTSQYERLAEEGVPWQRMIALFYLDRMEEAMIMAWEQANSGEDASTVIALLIIQGKPEEAVRFFEERFENVLAYRELYPNGGAGTYMDIAFAYSSIGNAEKFEEAMRLARFVMDTDVELGGKNAWMTYTEALYSTMMGNRDKALSLLSEAVDAGLLVGTKFSKGWVVFKELDGDPEFEAIQARMVDHLNAERALLGLKPVSI